MARPKKRTTEKPTEATNGFLDALRFVGAILKDVGAAYETHIVLNNKTATAFNGVLASGALIQEDIHACPNYKLFTEALSKCGQNLSITQLDNNRISIKSDKFKALVPCLEQSTFAPIIPDMGTFSIDDTFKIGLDAVGMLATEGAQSVVAASILMNGQTLIATNRVVMFEFWHGKELPDKVVLPKALITPLTKNTKKLSTFGYSPNSATFYYEDDSWIRTQLFAEQWPDVRRILDGTTNPFPLPADFWQGLEAVAPFSTDGTVHFENNRIQSHANPDTGASFEVSGLPRGPIHSIKQLMLIKPHATSVDFFAPTSSGTMLKFFGERIRGAIAGRNE